jgi:hypothetical protein
VNSTEITRFNNLKSLFSDSGFSQILVLQVGVDLSFLGILCVLKFQLSGVLSSVSNSLILEFGGLVDFILSGNDINVDLVDGSLEISVLSIQLFDSLFEVGDVLSFQSGQVVQSVNDLNSEFVQGVHNLSDDSLVAEVLVRSQ